ncbi:MAG: hypothetical protein AAF580_11975 [Pseudomonadota bacterium]
MNEADWQIMLTAFQAARSRRGDKGRDDRTANRQFVRKQGMVPVIAQKRTAKIP